jgi:hypothetical protein
MTLVGKTAAERLPRLEGTRVGRVGTGTAELILVSYSNLSLIDFS